MYVEFRNLFMFSFSERKEKKFLACFIFEHFLVCYVLLQKIGRKWSEVLIRKYPSLFPFPQETKLGLHLQRCEQNLRIIGCYTYNHGQKLQKPD